MQRHSGDPLIGRLKASLENNWRRKARPEQLPPAGDWEYWLILSGRGWGKSWTGANVMQEWAMTGTASRIAVVGATASDVRDVMVEGPAGILSVAPNHFRPEYEPSKRRLTWPNGAVATTFSADEPDRLRGPQHDAAWGDELAAWRFHEAWDNLLFGLRLGQRPRCIVTTTPRPTKIIRDLVAREGQDVVVTRGKTSENAANLAPTFYKAMLDKYGGTRIGRQELDGELLNDVPGALWQREWFDRDRVERVPEDLQRIVVAIDPAVSNNENSDETGIIVAGRAKDGQLYVLEDVTARLSPLEWCRLAVRAFHRWEADRIVAETNNGGALVEATLRQVEEKIPYREVKASRGKALRAEPISALYEQGKVHHVADGLARLEDQMCSFTSDFNRSAAGYSPDRVDALVWALTELSEGLTPMVISDEIVARSRLPIRPSGASYGLNPYHRY